jgi:hypothetical protein
MDFTPNGVVLLTYAIKFIEWSNEKLNFSQRKKQNDDEESKEPDYSSCRSSSVHA